HVGGVGGDAIEPASERGIAFEGADLARGRPEGVLGDLFRVLSRAGDAQPEAIHAVAISLDEQVGRALILAPQGIHQVAVAVDLSVGHQTHGVFSYRPRYGPSSATHCSMTVMSFVSLVMRMEPSSDATRNCATASG